MNTRNIVPNWWLWNTYQEMATNIKREIAESLEVTSELKEKIERLKPEIRVAIAKVIKASVEKWDCSIEAELANEYFGKYL